MTSPGTERGEVSDPPPPVTMASTVKVERIDRTKRCPLLLRMFAKTGGHNRVSEYRQNQFPDNELSIHTWMDADLRELADLVKQTQSSARGKDATMEFSLVYPDKRGINVMKPVGAVHAAQEGEDDKKTLKQLTFQTGDFMDVAILLPNRDRDRPAADRPGHLAGPPGRDRDRDRDGRPYGRPGGDRGGDRGPRGDRGDRGPPPKRY